MILAVTMNPSVDISYQLSDFQLNDVNRCDEISKTAGGKGLNVARVVKLMQGNVLATGIIGGTLGNFITQELTKSKIPHDFSKTEKESRNCIALLHAGQQTEILEAGPTLTKAEGEAFLNKFTELLEKVKLVTVSGSLPKGLSASFYQQMLDIANKKGVPIVMDCSGSTLETVLQNQAKPLLIKPNLTELSQLEGQLFSEKDYTQLKAILQQERYQGIDWIVVSLGKNGAFVKYKEQFYQVKIPKIDVVNPVGSGDATVAGLAVALAENKSVEDTLKTAMTAGILNTLENKTGWIDLAYFDDYYKKIKVENY